MPRRLINRCFRAVTSKVKMCCEKRRARKALKVHGFYAFRLWRPVFCMGFKENLKYSQIFTWVLCTLDDFDCVLHGFMALLIFVCVLYGCCRFVGICLCVARVLLFC